MEKEAAGTGRAGEEQGRERKNKDREQDGEQTWDGQRDRGALRRTGTGSRTEGYREKRWDRERDRVMENKKKRGQDT